jgi:hypothetical protein
MGNRRYETGKACYEMGGGDEDQPASVHTKVRSGKNLTYENITATAATRAAAARDGRVWPAPLGFVG